MGLEFTCKRYVLYNESRKEYYVGTVNRYYGRNTDKWTNIIHKAKLYKTHNGMNKRDCIVIPIDAVYTTNINVFSYEKDCSEIKFAIVLKGTTKFKEENLVDNKQLLLEINNRKEFNKNFDILPIRIELKTELNRTVL